MSIKSKILELLTKEELMSSEISEKLNIKSDNIWVYLNILLKEKKVERLANKKPYYIYRATTPLAYLKRLCELMGEKMEFIKVPDEKDKELVIKIMEMIK